MATSCAARQLSKQATKPYFVRRTAIILGGVGWLFFGELIAGPAPSRLLAADLSVAKSAMETITADDAQNFVNVLADDALEGRETGTRGGRAAGTYLGEQFQRLKLRGGGVGGGYYQPFGANSRNLLGWIEGSDPELKKQFVLVTAHYDHIGYGKPSNSFGPLGQIHNGADDNASGDAGILETANAFNQLPQAPKRSVMFALWDAEEEGLLGSKYWIDHPTVPLANVAAVLNVDMIGRLRNSRVIVYGGRSSYDWRQLLSRDNEETGLLLDFDWLMKADSDHQPFFAAGVPVLMLHTGLHEDYHRPSDKADKINSAGLKTVSQLLFRAALDLADETARPKFRTAARSESPASQPLVEQLAPSPAGRLGITWDETQSRQGVLQIAAVAPDSAAAKAGLKMGDRILNYAGSELTGVEQLRQLVLATQGTVPIKVLRAANEQPIEMSIQPAGEPVRLGLAWRVDDAEPDAVLLVGITPGSPAEHAGLQLYDRIYEVNGRRFSSSDEFRQLTNSLASPLELLTETRGKIRPVTVERLEIVTGAAAPEKATPASAASSATPSSPLPAMAQQ
ncbi:MAG TPA: M28 family peptidase [Pirellulales bacterium]|nr:M28 family peptidase [Pirellulales bacterium]